MTRSLCPYFLFLVPGLVALPDIEIQQGRRLYTGYKVLRAHTASDIDRAAILQLEDGELNLSWAAGRPGNIRKSNCWCWKYLLKKVTSSILDNKAELGAIA